MHHISKSNHYFEVPVRENQTAYVSNLTSTSSSDELLMNYRLGVSELITYD